MGIEKNNIAGAGDRNSQLYAQLTTINAKWRFEPVNHKGRIPSVSFSICHKPLLERMAKWLIKHCLPRYLQQQTKESLFPKTNNFQQFLSQAGKADWQFLTPTGRYCPIELAGALNDILKNNEPKEQVRRALSLAWNCAESGQNKYAKQIVRGLMTSKNEKIQQETFTLIETWQATENQNKIKFLKEFFSQEIDLWKKFLHIQNTKKMGMVQESLLTQLRTVLMDKLQDTKEFKCTPLFKDQIYEHGIYLKEQFLSCIENNAYDTYQKNITSWLAIFQELPNSWQKDLAELNTKLTMIDADLKQGNKQNLPEIIEAIQTLRVATKEKVDFAKLNLMYHFEKNGFIHSVQSIDTKSLSKLETSYIPQLETLAKEYWSNNCVISAKRALKMAAIPMSDPTSLLESLQQPETFHETALKILLFKIQLQLEASPNLKNECSILQQIASELQHAHQLSTIYIHDALTSLQRASTKETFLIALFQVTYQLKAVGCVEIAKLIAKRAIQTSTAIDPQTKETYFQNIDGENFAIQSKKALEDHFNSLTPSLQIQVLQQLLKEDPELIILDPETFINISKNSIYETNDPLAFNALLASSATNHNVIQQLYTNCKNEPIEASKDFVLLKQIAKQVEPEKFQAFANILYHCMSNPPNDKDKLLLLQILQGQTDPLKCIVSSVMTLRIRGRVSIETAKYHLSHLWKSLPKVQDPFAYTESLMETISILIEQNLSPNIAHLFLSQFLQTSNDTLSNFALKILNRTPSLREGVFHTLKTDNASKVLTFLAKEGIFSLRTQTIQFLCENIDTYGEMLKTIASTINPLQFNEFAQVVYHSIQDKHIALPILQQLQDPLKKAFFLFYQLLEHKNATGTVFPDAIHKQKAEFIHSLQFLSKHFNKSNVAIYCVQLYHWLWLFNQKEQIGVNSQMLKEISSAITTEAFALIPAFEDNIQFDQKTLKQLSKNLQDSTYVENKTLPSKNAPMTNPKAAIDIPRGYTLIFPSKNGPIDVMKQLDNAISSEAFREKLDTLFSDLFTEKYSLDKNDPIIGAYIQNFTSILYQRLFAEINNARGELIGISILPKARDLIFYIYEDAAGILHLQATCQGPLGDIIMVNKLAMLYCCPERSNATLKVDLTWDHKAAKTHLKNSQFSPAFTAQEGKLTYQFVPLPQMQEDFS